MSDGVSAALKNCHKPEFLAQVLSSEEIIAIQLKDAKPTSLNVTRSANWTPLKKNLWKDSKQPASKRRVGGGPFHQRIS
jgi:hypothetical protein